MSDQLQQMGERIRALREILELSPEDVARRCDMTTEEYSEYESGSKDFSFSFLSNVAGIFGVDVLDIMSGDSPKLSTACVVRKGDGFQVKRRAAYDYKHLAFTFRGKLAEPFMVTVEPNEEHQPELHAHEGQEFNYVVNGQMTFFIGDITYLLDEGDSIYFDSGVPHAMKANYDRACKFLAVVMNKGE
ncbi:MAG: XRE family transcriptional regulator [Oscillospiraceae bacterium]|jgi:quercetin dioxygenase-like cupin family protein|nr:XRE family transcriptional regulator [Oscillospiraceae bacterium]